MRLWIGNLGYYWWSLLPKDPGIGYVKANAGTQLICQEFGIPEPEFDYMIWCTNVVQNWDTLKANWAAVDSLPGRKAWWSFDNHIWHHHERRSAEHFDFAFLAHKAHLAPYNGINHLWLPLCVVQFSIDELLELLPHVVKTQRNIDFQFRGMRYPKYSYNREHMLDLWFDYARKLGFNCEYAVFNRRSDFAKYHGADLSERAVTWLNSHTSISAPIHDDLSTRFFDGLFFGQSVFIPDGIPDLDSLIPTEVQTQVGVSKIDRDDPSILEEKLVVARNRDAADRLLQAFYILFHHHMNNRVATAFNHWMGETILEIDYPRIIDQALSKLTGTFSANEIYNIIDKALELGSLSDDLTKNNHIGARSPSNKGVYIFPQSNRWRRFQQGVRHRLLGNHDAAINLFIDLIKADADMLPAIRELGLTYFDSKSYNKALIAFDNALTIDSTDIDSRYSKALTFISMNRLAEALAELDILLGIDPKNLDALIQKGILLRQIGKHPEALECFRRVEKSQPGDLDLIVSIGISLNDIGRPQQALEYFDKALLIEPKNLDVQTQKGILLRKIGNYSEALKCFRLVEKFQPRDLDLMLNISISLKEIGRPQEALTYLDAALAIEPENLDVQIQKGILLRKIGKHADALECFRLVEKFQPQNLDLLINMGISLSDIGQPREALDCLDAALIIDSNNEQAKSTQSRIYASLAKWDDAIRILDKLIPMRPNALEYRLNRALYLRRSGKTRFARQEFERILAVDPQNFHAKLNLSICHREQNDNQMALNILEDTLRHNQQNSPALFQKALTLQKMQRLDEAYTVINKLLDIDPQFEPAIKAKKLLSARIAING